MKTIGFCDVNSDELSGVGGGFVPAAVAVLSATSFLYGFASGLVLRHMLR